MLGTLVASLQDQSHDMGAGPFRQPFAEGALLLSQIGVGCERTVRDKEIPNQVATDDGAELLFESVQEAVVDSIEPIGSLRMLFYWRIL